MSALAGMRLYCFPYAGGSAAAIYGKWRQQLPSWLSLSPVELPGRGRRISEPLHVHLSPLADQLAAEIGAELRQLQAEEGNTPYLFFGHSLGALLAYEVARRLVVAGHPGPALLFVAGADAPTMRNDQRFANLRTDQEVIAYLRELNGTPAEVLENQDLLDLMLPIIKADFSLCANYRHIPGDALDCPLHVMGGQRDTTTKASLHAWRHHSRGRFAVDMFEGDHFFINSAQRSVLARIVGAAQAHAQAVPGVAPALASANRAGTAGLWPL